MNKLCILFFISGFCGLVHGLQEQTIFGEVSAPIESTIVYELIQKVLDKGEAIITKQVVEAAFQELDLSDHNFNQTQISKLKKIALEAQTQPKCGMPKYEEFTATSLRQSSNNMGVELQITTPFHQAILDYLQPGQQVLDIGCAYGFNTNQALLKGASVLALDIEAAHIAVLVRDLDPKLLPNLKIDLAQFPENVVLNPDHYDLIILGQILHFLSPAQIELSLKSCLYTLKPGGEMILMVMTIYCPAFSGCRQVLLDRKKPCLENVKKNDLLGFPFYLAEIGFTGVNASHPQDQTITGLNLNRVGFNVLKQGTFSLGVFKNGDESSYSSFSQGDDFYFYMVTEKPIKSIKNICKSCDKPCTNKCKQCKCVYYCSRDCQVEDWPNHKKFCSKFKI